MGKAAKNDEKRKADEAQPSPYGDMSAPTEPDTLPREITKPGVLGVVHLEGTRKDRIENMVPHILASWAAPPYSPSDIRRSIVEAQKIICIVDEVLGSDDAAPPA